jgi:hypothetical protein|tara:strand:- start:97 stop:549 length:453 start_codon:yes stop_codon:yes gene_type:complete
MGKYQTPTDPYGHLEFGIGSEDDFYCFDYAELPNGSIKLHSVINSETGSFIQDGEVNEVSKAEAPEVALGMIDQALEWLVEGGDPCEDGKPGSIEHDIEGWNQDPYYFYRAVKQYCEDGKPGSVERKIPDYNPHTGDRGFIHPSDCHPLE